MSNERIHTLIITQDQDWLSSLSIHLWQHGFAPLTIAPTSDYALDLFHQSPPQLALIDLDTCNGTAFDLCLEMHSAQPSLPIILVQTGDTVPSFATLYTGVASYVNRELTPAAWPGLLAFILSGGMVFSQNVAKTILGTAPPVQRRPSVLTVGRLRIDVVQREVSYGKQPIKLTPREFALLTFLTRNPDRMITFDQLLNEVWGYDDNCGSPAQVRLYVARVRNKLNSCPHVPEFILTERGLGYRFHSEALWQANESPPRVRHSRNASCQVASVAGYLQYPVDSGNTAAVTPSHAL